MTEPHRRPSRPHFSSGPCAKRPGWSLEALSDAAIGRSHRAKAGKTKLAEVISRSRAVLGLPDDYLLAIVPASDTGAFEMAMWSMLGARGTDLLVWESFGQAWATDATKQLKLPDCHVHAAGYGALPDLSQVDPDRDTVFCWNGTTSGARVPNGDWIRDDRGGLTLCDATSAVFAMAIPWQKIDVATWSWQKALGGEGQHGMLVLSPRAVERLESYTPPWPLPKIFRMTKGGKLTDGLFKGETINTPSMLCVEDAIDGLTWAEEIGGLPALIARTDANLLSIANWVGRTPWVDFLAADPAVRSSTSICLKISDPWFEGLPDDRKAGVPKAMTALLESQGVAYDVNHYREAPPGLRVWGGATVENDDIEALLPWLDWAYERVQAEYAAAA